METIVSVMAVYSIVVYDRNDRNVKKSHVISDCSEISAFICCCLTCIEETDQRVEVKSDRS